MATNNYLNKTSFETFQTLGYGDRIWPDVETENWQKVENKILAMNLENYLIARGEYQAISSEDLTQIQISLSSSETAPAFEGSINGNYFKISDTITWTVDTTSDDTYYLYLTEITGQIDPTSVDSLDPEVSTLSPSLLSQSDKKIRLIMVSVGVSSGTATITINPPEQLTSNSFLAHVVETTNPHGETLTQTTLAAESIILNGQPLVMEGIYDVEITPGSDMTLDIDSTLVIPNGDAQTREVQFVGFTPTLFNMTDDNPLVAAPYIIWITYDVTDKSLFTIHSSVTPSTTYSTIEMRLFIKYTLAV